MRWVLKFNGRLDGLIIDYDIVSFLFDAGGLEFYFLNTSIIVAVKNEELFPDVHRIAALLKR